VAESASYRSIIVASQYVSWLLGQLLRLRYDVRAHRPAGLFEKDREHCLILASAHKTIFDPWLLMIALSYRHFRTLVPVWTLATQTFQGPLRWLQWIKPLIEVLYSVEGVIELPPENDDGGFHSEKVRGLLVALKQGDVVAIFPEGEIWRKRYPPVGNSPEV
jgi:1-acyl-sn-glycerol-3-phosphate acyltransferase